MKKIHIIGGGTFSHVRNHLALAAPAFGKTANVLHGMFTGYCALAVDGYETHLHLTKMADPTSEIVTNYDMEAFVDRLVTDPETKIIVFNAAMCDYHGQIGDVRSGKYAKRLHSREGEQTMTLTAADKILKRIRKVRKDIFLVAFKTTCGATETEQYIAGLNLLKENSVNLVVANDTGTRLNMVIVPEEAKYAVTTDRLYALDTMVDMAIKRSQLTFTRSTVIDAPSVDWNDPEVPESLRTVVNYCIDKGAYKPFRGNTAGHFAVKVNDHTFLTSKRSTNFNNLAKIGLVKVESTGPDEVIAYGAKPSVGGQSQRIIFSEHEDVDCIVHFHCPLKPEFRNTFPIRKQYAYECGSHECGKNTSDGLKLAGYNIKAVYLDEHGPNIVFNRDIDPTLVTGFIDHYFDLSQKTGGPVEIAH